MATLGDASLSFAPLECHLVPRETVEPEVASTPTLQPFSREPFGSDEFTRSTSADRPRSCIRLGDESPRERYKQTMKIGVRRCILLFLALTVGIADQLNAFEVRGEFDSGDSGSVPLLPQMYLDHDYIAILPSTLFPGMVWTSMGNQTLGVVQLWNLTDPSSPNVNLPLWTTQLNSSRQCDDDKLFWLDEKHLSVVLFCNQGTGGFPQMWAQSITPAASAEDWVWESATATENFCYATNCLGVARIDANTFRYVTSLQYNYSFVYDLSFDAGSGLASVARIATFPQAQLAAGWSYTSLALSEDGQSVALLAWDSLDWNGNQLFWWQLPLPSPLDTDEEIDLNNAIAAAAVGVPQLIWSSNTTYLQPVNLVSFGERHLLVVIAEERTSTVSNVSLVLLDLDKSIGGSPAIIDLHAFDANLALASIDFPGRVTDHTGNASSTFAMQLVRVPYAAPYPPLVTVQVAVNASPLERDPNRGAGGGLQPTLSVQSVSPLIDPLHRPQNFAFSADGDMLVEVSVDDQLDGVLQWNRQKSPSEPKYV